MRFQDGAIYENTESHMQTGDQFTIVSDGVLEAANPQGELLGFYRTRDLSTKSAGQHCR